MPEETIPQPNPDSADSQRVSSGQPIIGSGSQRVIQPSPELLETIKAQQEQQAVQAAPVMTAVQPQPMPAATQQSAYPQTDAQAGSGTQMNMSANQLGLNQPTRKITRKKSLIKGAVGLVIAVGIFATLIFTNIIAFSEFKTVNYTTLSGAHYSFEFYTKHSTKTLKSGSTQLVSEVSKEGKLPMTMLISTEKISVIKSKGLLDCTGSFPKLFDVQNINLNQNISVCYLPQDNGPVGVYLASFIDNNHASTILFTQDISKADLSSPSAARKSLTTFGLSSYNNDVKRIISSIKVQ